MLQIHSHIVLILLPSQPWREKFFFTLPAGNVESFHLKVFVLSFMENKFLKCIFVRTWSHPHTQYDNMLTWKEMITIEMIQSCNRHKSISVYAKKEEKTWWIMQIFSLLQHLGGSDVCRYRYNLCRWVLKYAKLSCKFSKIFPVYFVSSLLAAISPLLHLFIS